MKHPYSDTKKVHSGGTSDFDFFWIFWSKNVRDSILKETKAWICIRISIIMQFEHFLIKIYRKSQNQKFHPNVLFSYHHKGVVYQFLASSSQF